MRACKHVGARQHKHLNRFPRHTPLSTLCRSEPKRGRMVLVLGPGRRGGGVEGQKSGGVDGWRSF